MTREEAIGKAITIVSYFEAHFAKTKEAREDAANIIEALEQEPIDCANAEHDADGCLGYSTDRGGYSYCQTCLKCPKASINNWDKAQEPCEVEATKLQQAYNKGFEDCRQAAINLIESIETERLKGNVELIYAPAIKGLRALPPVTPQPKVGQWIYGEDFETGHDG